jgi:hypothetical protein
VNIDIQAKKLQLSRQIPSNVDSWSLAEMIEVARAAKLLSDTSSQIGHAIRDWRNLIHPKLFRQKYPAGIPTDVALAAIANANVLLREIGEKW